MKKTLLTSLIAVSIISSAIISFNYLSKTTDQITTEAERVEYEKFINEHKILK